MHILGKVLLWFVLLGGIASVVLTGRMLQVRAGWTKKADIVEAQYNAAEVKRVALRKTLGEAKAELDRTNFGWNRYWNQVQAAVDDPNAGTLRLNVGTLQGLKQDQTIYAFQPNPDGTTHSYVGPFKITAIQENASALAPGWSFRPSEPMDSWKPGPGWRFREEIPVADKVAFSDLDVAFTSADNKLVDKQKNLTAQENLAAAAQLHLDLRKGELNGDPNLDNLRGKLPQEMVDGLVIAIKDAEEERNAALNEVDQLRRDLRNSYLKFQSLQAANSRLSQSLPGAKVPVSAKLPGSDVAPK